jgi:hypothetical protein
MTHLVEWLRDRVVELAFRVDELAGRQRIRQVFEHD